MADDTDTTRPGETEAGDPVAAALFKFEGYDDPYDVALNADYNQPEHWVEEYRDRARAAIAVAYPVIAAAVREQAAQERMHGDHQFEPGIDTDMIAEGRQSDPRWCNICGEPR